jgi:hypothetical protein
MPVRPDNPDRANEAAASATDHALDHIGFAFSTIDAHRSILSSSF